MDEFDANVTEAEASAPSGSDKSLGALRDEYIAKDASLQQNSSLRQAFDATVYTLVSLHDIFSWLDRKVLFASSCRHFLKLLLHCGHPKIKAIGTSNSVSAMVPASQLSCLCLRESRALALHVLVCMPASFSITSLGSEMSCHLAQSIATQVLR